ncbi:MAG: DUF1351 domain-containing protein [Coriobacteriales bacterium]|nr:DUF1351 domain-containing protein [Coriobacteriaceae bacterium]MDY2723921.1 DUF1351 domain-containing protein [Coriobacteriales bacterium]
MSVEELSAEVIDRELMDPTAYERWLSEQGTKVAKALMECKHVKVTDEATYRSAKASRKELRQVIGEVDGGRKAATAELRKMLDRIKEDTDGVLADARARDAALKAEVDAWDAGGVERKRQELAKAYEEFAPALVPLVPFERIWDELAPVHKWANKSCNVETAKEQMFSFVERIGQDEKTIDGLDMPDDDREQVKTDFFGSLDLGDAIAKERERIARRERVAELERMRQEQASEPEPTQEAQETEQMPAPKVPRVLVFEVNVPIGKVDSFVAAMKALGSVHGHIVRRVY